MDNNMIREIGIDKSGLEKALVIQRTVSEAVLDCMKKGKFRLEMEYDPEFPKVILKVYSTNCDGELSKKMEF